MADTITVYTLGSPEYLNLSRAADLLSGLSPKGWTYYAGETYFDAGQGWKWSTILRVENPVQFITPAEQEKIVLAKTPNDVLEVVQEIAKNRNSDNW